MERSRQNRDLNTPRTDKLIAAWTQEIIKKIDERIVLNNWERKMRAFAALIFHDEWFRSIANILIGFLIAQLTGYSAERRERRKAASCALSDLLMVRHQLFGLEEIVENLGNIVGNVPEHEKSQLRVAFNSLLPKWEELHSRYDHSVTTLAGLDPLLAFELRSKDFILPTLNCMHSLMAQDPQAAALIGPIFKANVLDKIKPVLDKSLVSLAKKKNLLCWYQIWRFVKKGGRISDELAEFLKSIQAIVEKQKAATATHTGEANKPQSA
jgi:hypothetical protein